METEIHYIDHKPSLKEAQKLVGGYVERIDLPDGRQMLVDEDGKTKGKPLNEKATELLNKNSTEPFKQIIVGDVIVLDHDNIW